MDIEPGAGDLEKMLGRTSAHWDDLKTHIAAEYSPLDETWNFAKNDREVVKKLAGIKMAN